MGTHDHFSVKSCAHHTPVKQRHDPPAWGKTTKGTGKWKGKGNTRSRHLQMASTGKGKASKGFQGQVAGYDGWAEPRHSSGRQGGAPRNRKAITH